MDTTSALFYLFSAVMLFAAFRVITANNTVHAAARQVAGELQQLQSALGSSVSAGERWSQLQQARDAAEKEADPQKIQEGNQLIFHKLVKILDSKGLKPMEDLIGKAFDPDTQEAITQIPSPSPEFKGAVVDVVEKGYLLGEKVVRFAKVVTGA